MKTSNFKYQSENDWQKAAEKLLKGKSLKETLYTITDEGITLKPIYFENEKVCFQLPINNKKWLVAQTLFSGNENFNARAKDVLNKGQTALNINLDAESQLGIKTSEPNKIAIRITDYNTFSELLDGINIQQTPLFFNAFNTADKFYNWLLKLCDENSFDKSKIQVALGADLISAALIYGGYSVSFEDSIKNLVPVLINTQIPGVEFLTINSDIIHNSGGHKIHELIYALGSITSYINGLADLDVEPEIAMSSIRIKMAVANDQFMEIAKLRAMRWLWQNICAAYKVENVNAKIDVVTSWRFLSHLDPHTNMLRATGQAFSAIIGGCDSLDVLPFDFALNQPGEFSLRQARNVQIVLAEESNLDKVQDPSLGSNYLENLTVELAEKSWHEFQQLQKQGGIIKSIQSGHFQSEIKKNAARQEKDFAEGSKKAIGVNCFQVEEENGKKTEGSYYNQTRLFNDVEPLQLKRLL